MGIADIISQGPPRKNTCLAASIIAELQPKDAKAVVEAMEKIKAGQPGYSTIWLQKILASEGKKIGATTIQRHVNGVCACGTK
jgi:hypothetical protein